MTVSQTQLASLFLMRCLFLHSGEGKRETANPKVRRALRFRDFCLPWVGHEIFDRGRLEDARLGRLPAASATCPQLLALREWSNCRLGWISESMEDFPAAVFSQESRIISSEG